MTRSELDGLGVAASFRPMQVRFGMTDVSLALRGGSLNVSLESGGNAQLRFDSDWFPPDPVDYLAPLTLRSTKPGGRAHFVGHAAHAVRDDSGHIEVTAFGASLLTESRLGLFNARDVTSAEVTHLMARAAGMSDDELFIAELDELEHETFEVIAPLYGVTSAQSRRLAGVSVLPAASVLERVAQFGFEDVETMSNADAFALSIQTARLGFYAEQAGLREIDNALAWLTTRLRHALAVLPDGALQHFDREERRALPRRGDYVVVRGLLSGRRWLRSASMERFGTTVPLGDDDPLLDEAPERLEPSQWLALAACRRAASETEPLARVQALWEAIEFIVAGVRVPRRWADADLKALRDAIPEGLPEALRNRALSAIGDLNQVPLMARLRHVVEDDGLPCSDDDIELLAALRRVRNDAAHGRDAETPSPDQLDRATAVVCRLAVERLMRR